MPKLTPNAKSHTKVNLQILVEQQSAQCQNAYLSFYL